MNQKQLNKTVKGIMLEGVDQLVKMGFIPKVYKDGFWATSVKLMNIWLAE